MPYFYAQGARKNLNDFTLTCTKMTKEVNHPDNRRDNSTRDDMDPLKALLRLTYDPATSCLFPIEGNPIMCHTFVADYSHNRDNGQHAICSCTGQYSSEVGKSSPCHSGTLLLQLLQHGKGTAGSRQLKEYIEECGKNIDSPPSALPDGLSIVTSLL